MWSPKALHIGRFLGLLSSLLIFASAFLPSGEGFHENYYAWVVPKTFDPTYPYKIATKSANNLPFGIPYICALLCGLAILMFVRAQRRPVSRAVKSFSGIVLLVALLFGCLWLCVWVWGQGLGQLRTFSIVAGLAHFLLVYALWRGRKLVDEAARVGRVLWVAGVMLTIWFMIDFVYHPISPPLYGAWVSLVAALLLSTSGVLIEKAPSS